MQGGVFEHMHMRFTLHLYMEHPCDFIYAQPGSLGYAYMNTSRGSLTYFLHNVTIPWTDLSHSRFDDP